MIQPFFNFLFAILFFSGLCACHKNAGKDTESPKISIVAPLMNDTVSITNGDELHIEFTCSDNVGLHNLQIKLYDEVGTEYFNSVPDVMNLKVYPFHTHLSPTLSATRKMKLQIFAEDHAMNAVKEEVQFVGLP